MFIFSLFPASIEKLNQIPTLKTSSRESKNVSQEKLQVAWDLQTKTSSSTLKIPEVI